ncbi:Ig-like domain-containing protein [Oryzobacter sp. R7]|uniref:Ig-like domain-containing protein n=1 Tax=Oryzobacter faecalis TaxID=3388656 RepID=UPI00398CA759
MRSLLVRLVAIVALVLAGAAVPLQGAAANGTTPPELSFACALKSNGQLRVVTSLSQCTKNETKIQMKPGPVLVCVQPSGSSRYVTSFSQCKPPARTLTLPPTSGVVTFCADNATRVLRYVTDPSQCLATETAYQVTPNDAAPTLASSTPADGATRVATTATVRLTFSEAVSAPASAFVLACGGGPLATVLTGSPGTTLQLSPIAALPEGATCTVDVTGSAVSDVDTLDPPDTMATNPRVSFRVDTAPTLTSTTPAHLATGVAVDGDLELTFSEPVDLDPGAVSLTCGDSEGLALGVTGSGTSTVTVDPVATLPGGSTCNLVVTGSKVHDVDAGDPPDVMATDRSVVFVTEDAAPTVVSTSPVDGAVDVSPSTTLSVTFSEYVTAAAGAFSLECGASPVAVTFDPGPALTLVVTPTAALPKSSACTLTGSATAISDSDTVDPPDHPASDLEVSFTTASNSDPTDIALSPSAVAENQPPGTTVGSLSTTDADPGDTFTYTLVSGTGDTDNGLFQVDGTSLETAAVLSAEDGATRSVRVQTEDSAGGTFTKVLTVTVTDVNEAPTSLALSPRSVDENEPAGTTVGALSASDEDTPPQALTYSVESSGCGGTYPDAAAFAVSGSDLVTAVVLNYEVKSSYEVCVRVTDDGTPALGADRLFTVTVNDVNDAPRTLPDSYTGAVGNTMFALNLPGTPAPRVAVTGSVLTANDSDEDGDTVTAVAETVTSAGGGTATIDTAGNFTFLPGVGDKNQTDSFTYRVTDGTATTAGTVQVAITGALIWWVDNSSTTATPDGRSTSPLTSLTALNGADPSADLDGTGETIFVWTGNATYAGGLRLEANQSLLGERAGVTVGPMPLLPAGATAPVLTNASGNGVDLADVTTVSGIDIANASGDGVHGVGIGTATIGSSGNVTISGSGADGIDLSGAGSGAISVGASVTTSTARSLAVSGRTGSTVAVSGAITGKGVELSGNTGATIAFTGALALSTTTTPAFSATGGGTVTVAGSTNTATSTTGGAVVVENTTIGAAGMTFRSASANGAVNGIRLTNTGATAGLSVTGTGSVVQGGDASGGTIQATTGAGIVLTNTRTPSFNNVSVLNVPTAAGVRGTSVSGFTFTNGRVSGSGLTGSDNASANLAFNAVSAGVTNLSGAVNVSNSVLENAYGSGVDVYNESGTISSLTVSGNLIQSTTSTATSKGHGVIVQSLGSASAASGVTTASIADNRVLHFPSGGGILLYGGNVSGLAAPATTLGAGAGAKVLVSGNVVRGASDAVPMNTNCIYVSVAGRGTGFVDVQANGTAGEPLGANRGNCISVNSTGSATLVSQVTGNRVSPGAGHVDGAFGITAGAAKQTVVGPADLNSAVLDLTVDGNTVSASKSTGIFLLTRDSGTLRTRVQNNTVAAPVELAGEAGIVVRSGDLAAGDASVCLQIQSNTTAGSVNGATGDRAPGIGLRKQGADAAINDFGVVGLVSSPTLQAGVVSHVSNSNPASALGTGGYGTSGAYVISGNNFVPCTLPF